MTLKLTCWINDVWGNEDDGYEVNDRSKAAVVIVEEMALTDEELRETIDAWFGTKGEGVEVDYSCSDDQHIQLVLNDKTHSDYPIGSIEVEET